MDFLEYIEILKGLNNFEVTPISVVVALIYIATKINWATVRKYAQFSTVDEYDSLYVKLLKELIGQSITVKTNIHIYLRSGAKETGNLYSEVALFSTFNGYTYSKEFAMEEEEIGTLVFILDGVSRVSTKDSTNIKFRVAHEDAAVRNAGKDICWYSFISTDKNHSYIVVLTFNDGHIKLNANLITNLKTILKDFIKIKP